MESWMKQKSIEKQIRNAIHSSIITFCIRIVGAVVIGLLLYHRELHLFWSIILWTMLVGIAIQMLFMPYLTWVRIKELKEGELYEASQY